MSVKKAKAKVKKSRLTFRLKIFALLGVSVFLVAEVLVLRGILPMTKASLVRSDRLADVYNPPGAATPSAIHQTTATLPPASKSVRVPILLYHYVEYNPDPKDFIRTRLSVTPFWFEKQLQYLQANGYQTITFDVLDRAINKGGRLPPRPVIITFDDGYRDFYTDAWPLLKKYNMKATEFVIAGFLDKPNYMFSWQLLQIATDSSRLVTIGAHTMHHPSLPSLKTDQAFAEIFDSKQLLEHLLGRPVTVFNYPYGQFNNAVVEDVKQAGFQMAVSTLFGETESWQNLFILPRIRVGNYSGATFASRLTVKS